MAYLVLRLQLCIVLTAAALEANPEVVLDTRVSEAQLDSQLTNFDGLELLFAILVIEIAANVTAWADPLDLYLAKLRVMTCSPVNGAYSENTASCNSTLHAGSLV